MVRLRLTFPACQVVSPTTMVEPFISRRRIDKLKRPSLKTFIPILALVTRLFSFEGDELYLNMEGRMASPELRAASPKIKVEVIGPDHRPLEGLKLEDADPMTKTGRHRVSWGGKSDLSKLAGTPIQLKISIQNAKLYSFQFE